MKDNLCTNRVPTLTAIDLLPETSTKDFFAYLSCNAIGKPSLSDLVNLYWCEKKIVKYMFATWFITPTMKYSNMTT